MFSDNKPHVLNISFTRWLNVWLNEESWSFRITCHDNFLNKTNLLGSFIVVKALKNGKRVENELFCKNQKASYRMTPSL